ncbi:MAG: ABC transporter permease [Ruminococcus sp.]|nr:ABC transporter permease [Ruminococcus sp.]MBQ4261828.1 ABC transporter permease [Ruminococcus sp.]
MFFRMIKGALFRQKSKMIMIAVTIALGASLATAMLNIMLDVGDKVNQELKAYGANITVVPKENSVLTDLYALDGQEETAAAHLKEDDLGKIKTIFWGFNILDFTPFVNTTVVLDDETEVKLTGTWFNHHLALNTGEELDAGIHSLRSWWDVKNGQWLDEQKEGTANGGAMVGTVLAERLGISSGDSLHVKTSDGEKTLSVVGVFDSGGDEDEQIFTTLATAQELSGTKGLIDSIEVSALTTPDNELAKKAATKGPGSLSPADYETWYCTAYVSSICYQIQEAIPDSVASPVRQVAESEGNILDKTQLLMILITILSLFGSALGISNLVTASVMERSNEIGLLKAIGARDYRISGIVLTEIIITAVVGGVAGYFMGYGFAQVIGQTVFNSSIEMKPMVIPIVAVLIVIVTLAGSIPAIRMLLRLRPAEVLHGR